MLLESLTSYATHRGIDKEKWFEAQEYKRNPKVKEDIEKLAKIADNRKGEHYARTSDTEKNS